MNDSTGKALVLRGIHFRYGRTGTAVLEGLDLDVCRGDLVFLEGSNGAGKSTLMNIIARVIEPQRGEVVNHCRQLEYLQQDYVRSLFPWHTAAWNICLPLLASKRLKRRDLKTKAQNLCDEMGVDLRLDDYPYNFSGGQKHLITLLRAFASSPDLLLLDEPATGLDQVHIRKFWSTLVRYKDCNPELTVICATHQMPDLLPFSCKRLNLVGHPPILQPHHAEEIMPCDEPVSAR